MKIIIPENERAIVMEDGIAVAWLKPGKHRIFNVFKTVTITRYEMSSTCVWTPEIERLAPEKDAQTLVVEDHQLALIYRDGRAHQVLGTGKYVLWQVREKFTATLLDVTDVVIRAPAAFALLMPVRCAEQVVAPYERALVYVDGTLHCVLEEGRYFLANRHRTVRCVLVELREKEFTITGQELLTRDKVTLRLNLIVKFKITDPVKSVQEVQDLYSALYSEAQVLARRFVASFTVEELIERRNEAVGEMAENLQQRAAQWGVEVIRVDVKDVILPGEMKTILNRVIEAQKQAEANNILRREETAATRSLANTAKLMEQNPTLLRLKELETLKEVSQNVEHFTFVAGQGLQSGTISGA